MQYATLKQVSRSTRHRRQLRRARQDDLTREPLGHVAEGEPVRQWLGPVEFTHRGRPILRVLPMAIIVVAEAPGEMSEPVDEEIVTRTRRERAS